MIRITLGLAVWTIAIWANRAWNIINESSESSLFGPILFICGSVALLISLYLWSENHLKSVLFAGLVTVFGLVSVGRWGWSLTNAWTEANSLVFRLIHTALALTTAVLCFRAAQLIWKISVGERKLEELSGG